MKKGYCFLVSLCSFIGLAQPASDACDQLKTQVREAILMNHIGESEKLYHNWYKDCPTAREEQFQLRMELMDYALVEKFTDEKTALADLEKYMQTIKAEYPNKRMEIQLKEAYAMSLFQAPNAQVYKKLDEVFTTNPQAFTLGDHFFVYYESASRDWKAEDWKKILQFADKVELFFYADGRLESKEARNYTALTRKMQEQFMGFVPKDSVVPYYRKQHEEYYKNADWHRMVLDRLEGKGLRLDLFTMTIAERGYELRPNRRSAELLGLINYQNGNTLEAEQWYLKAIKQMNAPSDIASVYFNLGSSVMLGSDKAKAKKYLNLAAETSKEKASALVVLAQMYQAAQAECATTDQEKHALSLLAARTLDRAIALSPSMKESLEKSKGTYLEKFPTAEEMKKNKWRGKTVHIGCWIDENVIFDK